MSTPSKLKRQPQAKTTPQPTTGFDPVYPEEGDEFDRREEIAKEKRR